MEKYGISLVFHGISWNMIGNYGNYGIMVYMESYLAQPEFAIGKLWNIIGIFLQDMADMDIEIIGKYAL